MATTELKVKVEVTLPRWWKALMYAVRPFAWLKVERPIKWAARLVRRNARFRVVSP